MFIGKFITPGAKRIIKTFVPPGAKWDIREFVPPGAKWVYWGNCAARGIKGYRHVTPPGSRYYENRA